MIVEDLIKELQKFDQSKEVRIRLSAIDPLTYWIEDLYERENEVIIEV